ncbi:hypothetical protein KY285_023138 [Solanum tuberosum]|nr:hypothetical protein KY285_023138 [Solanum tuberosum]
MLKSGTIMPMPDIKDKMPKRSFLPRVAKMINDPLSECERAPSAGETKRCPNSAEDMIDFANISVGPKRRCSND